MVAETYDNGFTETTPHPLFSGTKSFWGVAGNLHAQNDGVTVARRTRGPWTIELWREDPWKRRVTLRMLLALTSGFFGFGGLRQRRAALR